MELLPKLLRAREQKKRSNPLSFFVPNPGTDQESFFTHPARERWIIASNRWGKTECGAVEAVAWATGDRRWRDDIPEATTGWIVSKSYQMQRDIIQPKIRKYIPAHRIANITYRMADVWDRIVLTCATCGRKPRATGEKRKEDTESWWCSTCNLPCSVIGFKSEDQGREKFQGVSLHWCWIDEEIDEEIYEEIKFRLIDNKGYLWGTMTPVKGLTWTFDRIFKSEEPESSIKVFGGSMYDNPWLDPEEIAKAERETPDPARRRIRIYGEYQTLSGLIYGGWDPTFNEVIELPKHFFSDDGDTLRPEFDIYCGIDTGKFFAATFWLCDYFGNLWGFAEHYAEGASLRSNAKAIRAICRKYGIWPTFVLDGTSQFETDLAEEGIPCTKIFDPVDVGIQLTINYMTSRAEQSDQPRLYVVSPEMKRWLWELQRYQIEPAAKSGAAAGAPRSTPLKKNDHALDSSRYVICLRPIPSEPSFEADVRPMERRMREAVMQRLQERDLGRDKDREEFL